MSHVPFLHFSAAANSVIPFPLTPQVPIPTRPLTLSGDANILFLITPFFVVWKTENNTEVNRRITIIRILISYFFKTLIYSQMNCIICTGKR